MRPARGFLPVSAALLGLAAGCLLPGPARADPIDRFLACGNGMESCVQYCDYHFASVPLLSRCYDYCYRGAGVCEASRIPRPVGYRSHAPSRADRK
jgi:hypothetical protein